MDTFKRDDKLINELEEAYSKAKAMCDNSEPESMRKDILKGGYVYPVGTYAANLNDLSDSFWRKWFRWECPRIRKEFGLDDPFALNVSGLYPSSDIYETIKKQINKDQLNFRYGLSSSFFNLAPNDAAVPFELSEKEKEYVRNDVAATLSYGYYDYYDMLNRVKAFVNKEDNKMKKQQQKKRNRNIIKIEKYQRTIKDITFNGPAVIVKFEPEMSDIAYGRTKGDKVVVVCKDGDKYDMKTGFLLAILKEFLNNQSYGNVLEKLDSFDAFDIPKAGKESDKSTLSKFGLREHVKTKTGSGVYKIIDMAYIHDKDEWLYECINGNFKRTFWEHQLIPLKY